MSVDMSDFKAAVIDWANRGAGEALDRMRQATRDKAPYGVSEGGHDGPHLVDTEEARVTSEGERWEGTLAYTADHASYTDLGTGPHDIYGNPYLAFRVGGSLVIINASRTPVRHPGSHVHDGWFSDTVTDEAWAAALEESLGDLD